MTSLSKYQPRTVKLKSFAIWNGCIDVLDERWLRMKCFHRHASECCCRKRCVNCRYHLSTCSNHIFRDLDACVENLPCDGRVKSIWEDLLIDVLYTLPPDEVWVNRIVHYAETIEFTPGCVKDSQQKLVKQSSSASDETAFPIILELIPLPLHRRFEDVTKMKTSGSQYPRGKNDVWEVSPSGSAIKLRWEQSRETKRIVYDSKRLILAIQHRLLFSESPDRGDNEGLNQKLEDTTTSW